MSYILTAVIAFNASLTGYTVVYDTPQACESAKNITREQLRQGTILLLTCTPKWAK